MEGFIFYCFYFTGAGGDENLKIIWYGLSGVKVNFHIQLPDFETIEVQYIVTLVATSR